MRGIEKRKRIEASCLALSVCVAGHNMSLQAYAHVVLFTLVLPYHTHTPTG